MHFPLVIDAFLVCKSLYKFEAKRIYKPCNIVMHDRLRKKQKTIILSLHKSHQRPDK